MRGLQHRLALPAVVALVVAAALLAGCGLTPAPYPIPDTELAPRPGLLSGPTGEFTIRCCGRP